MIEISYHFCYMVQDLALTLLEEPARIHVVML